MTDIDDPSAAQKDIDKLANPARKNGRFFRGFNLFSGIDLQLFQIMAKGKWTISGIHLVNRP